MTAKKEDKKVFKLSDFYTKTNNNTATKMDLLYDGEQTGCHLMVLGIESKQVQRARIEAQVTYADIAEQAEKITDKVEKEEFHREGKEASEIILAQALVVDWSFGDFDKEKLAELLNENKGLSIAIMAHATTPGNYLAKK